MHLLVIFFIALLVFGPRKLPELGRGLGDGIRELKKGLQDASSARSISADPKSSDTKKV
jgi:sec-independent protein translocase protein TatA